MCNIEPLWIGLERAEARFGAEVDHPPAIFSPRKIPWIGMMEDPPAEGDETKCSMGIFLFCAADVHIFIAIPIILLEFRVAE